MKLIKRSRTCGALNRRFQRDMEFQLSETIAGPAATHAGDNSEMKLRYGTYPPKQRPRAFSFFGVLFLRGQNALSWASLSDLEANWLVWRTYAIGWK